MKDFNAPGFLKILTEKFPHTPTLKQGEALNRLANFVLEGKKDDVFLLKGFFQIPECTGLECLHGVLCAAIAGDDDGGEVGRQLRDLAHEFEAAHAWHLDVAEHEVELLRAQRFPRIGDDADEIAPRERLQRRRQRRAVHGEEGRADEPMPRRSASISKSRGGLS